MNTYGQHLVFSTPFFKILKLSQYLWLSIHTKLFQCELDWWGQQRLRLMQEQGVYQAKDLAAELHSE